MAERENSGQSQAVFSPKTKIPQQTNRESSPVALIMAGGGGTRFWPMSRPELPKQFLKLLGQESLLEATLNRVSRLVNPANTYICATASQKEIFQKHLPTFKNLILEPEARNTAPCLMLSLWELLSQGYPPETVMIVLPADHHIEAESVFQTVLKKAMACAVATGNLITLGITPRSAHTGYGYIEVDPSATASGANHDLFPKRGANHDALPVKRFLEKPDKAKAETFIQSKHFFWNSGMFVWTLKALQKAFETHLPEEWARLCRDGKKAYPSLKAQPIDIAVMEKSDHIFMIPADMGWSDLGSWDALYQLKATSADENVTISGKTLLVESKGCFVKVPLHFEVALVGVRDLIVVEDNNKLLIAHRGHDQKVKEISNHFSELSRKDTP